MRQPVGHGGMEELVSMPVDLAEANVRAASTERNHFLKVQPFKLLYMVWMLLSTVLLLVPAWMAWYYPINNRPRSSWPVSRCVRVRAMRRIQGLVARLELDHLGRDLSIVPDPTLLLHSSHTHIPPISSHLLLNLCGFPLECFRSLIETRGSWATPHPPSHPWPWNIPWLLAMFDKRKARKLGGTRDVRRGRQRKWKKGVLPWEKGHSSAKPNRAGHGTGTEKVAVAGNDRDILEQLEAEESGEGGAGFWFGERRGVGLGRGEEGDREGALVGLSFHGGAFVAGSSLETDGTANIPKHLVRRTAIKDVLSVDYRLAHCNPFPYPVLDALAAYHHLLVDKDIPPERIIIIGDSAGGHLALTLVRYLRDEGPALNLPMPGGLIVISPWCDVTFSVMGAPGTSGTTNRPSDIINDSLPPHSVSLYCRAIPASYLSSPYLSPCALHLPRATSGRASFEGFPKTFVIAGEAERLRDEIRELVIRMRECEGVVCGYEETYGAIHDFPIFPFQRLEMKSAFRSLSKFIDANFTISPPPPPSTPPSFFSRLPPHLRDQTPDSRTASPAPGVAARLGDEEGMVSAVAGIGGEVFGLFGGEEEDGGEGEEEDGGAGQMRRRGSWTGGDGYGGRRRSWGDLDEEEEWVELEVEGGGREGYD